VKLTNTQAFQRGILFGILASIAWIVYNLLVNLANFTVDMSNLVNNLFLVVLIVLFTLVGVLTAQKTGDFETGAYAGLIASFIGAVVGVITLFVITFLFMDTISQSKIMVEAFKSSDATDMTQFIIDDAFGGAIFGTLLSLALGGGMGAIGGLFGKMLASRAHA
jgi:hypothetical protein